MKRTATRRNWLKAVGVVGVTAGVSLAGCSGQSSTPTDESGGEHGGTDVDGGSTSAGGGSSAARTDTVEMTDELTFEPEMIQVPAGTTVTWENVGSIGHTITAYEDEIPEGATYFASGGFDSQSAAADGYPDQGNVPGDESYEHTFETTGTYEYYCVPHEMNGMVGTVEVV